jgi:hypothetical protein
MSDAQLQIVISVINNAADQLGELASQLSDLADETSSDAATMSDSMSSAASSMSDSVTGAASAMDDSMSGTATATADAGEEMESSINSVGGKIQAVGIQLGLMGAAIAAPAALAVKSAGDQVDAFDQLANSVKNVYASASAPTAGYATEVADLTAKINAEKSTISEADAALTKYSGTTAEIAAAHEKAATTIATAQVNIQKYQQELDNLTNSQSLAGGSAAATTAQFEAAAKASVNLGFSVTDSATALTYLFSSTQNVNGTMSAFQDAMDLAAKLQIPVAQAANDVVQAMNGQGRSLRDLGINVADGLSGQTALAAIQEKVAGAAQDAATHGLGPYNVATAQLNEAMAQFGVTVLPILASFFEQLSKIITAVGNWADAHPKLAEALIVFLGLLGGLLIVLGAIILPLGLIVITIEAFTTVTAVLGTTLLGLLGTFALIAAGVIAFIAVIALVIVFHKQIMDAIQTAWTWIVTQVTNATSSVSNTLKSWGADLSQWWTSFWGAIYSTLEGIWSKIESIISSIASAISKVTAPVASIAGAIGATVGGAIKAFAQGGIVSSPTLALVGEAGPEAIIPLSAFTGGPGLAGGSIGGGGSIQVFIQGGTYLDQGGAQMIAAALAQQIGRQLKLKNFF